MNKLALVQRLRQECGASGSGPVTTVGQVGEMKRLVDWIDQSWLEIQEKRNNWNWMVEEFSFQSVVGQFEYTPTEAGIATTFANWRGGDDSMRSFLTSVGVGSEMYMREMNYRSFRDYYLFSTRRTSLAQPLEFAVNPKKNLLVGPPPVDVYTIHGEYYTLPTEMVANTDIPSMPPRFHMLIVYKAMTYYGMYEAAPEVVQRGQMGFDEMIKKLEDDQLFDIQMAGPLA